MSRDAMQARYSVGAEFANSVTHGCGLVLSVVGLVVLVAAAAQFGRAREVVSCGVYGCTLILVYLSSMLYHGSRRLSYRRLLRTLDHIAIFLLIAGTYTPFVLIALRGVWGWSLFAIIWLLAAIGVTLELSSFHRHRHAMIVLYIAMGWVGLIALKPLTAALPGAGLWLLFGGGISYTLGVAFYVWRSLRHHHAVWHLFVMVGSVLQYLAVLWYVLPGRG